jgi:hypothetical protein
LAIEGEQTPRIVGILEMHLIKESVSSASKDFQSSQNSDPQICNLIERYVFTSVTELTIYRPAVFDSVLTIHVGALWSDSKKDPAQITKPICNLALSEIQKQIQQSLNDQKVEFIRLVCHIGIDNTFWLTLISYGFMTVIKNLFNLNENPEIDLKMDNCFLSQTEKHECQSKTESDLKRNGENKVVEKINKCGDAGTQGPKHQNSIFSEPRMKRGIACFLSYEVPKDKTVCIPIC